MKTLIPALGFLFILLSSITVVGQDAIHKKSGDVIECSIKEIGLDEIKYTVPGFGPDLKFSIAKEKVNKVVFSNGQEMIIKDEMTNPDNYQDNFRNALKVDFLSPLTGNTTIYYERSLKPGRSIEAGLGIVGLGLDPAEVNPAGVFTKFGVKFIKSPDVYLRGMRYAHVLKGAYVKPELILGYFARDYDNYWEGSYWYYGTTRREVFIGSIMLNFGKQWVIDNSFLVDFFVGAGYGFDSGDYDEGYQYAYVGGAEDIPISFSAGLKIGWLFK
jgi:hypothetical protein